MDNFNMDKRHLQGWAVEFRYMNSNVNNQQSISIVKMDRLYLLKTFNSFTQVKIIYAWNLFYLVTIKFCCKMVKRDITNKGKISKYEDIKVFNVETAEYSL